MKAKGEDRLHAYLIRLRDIRPIFTSGALNILGFNGSEIHVIDKGGEPCLAAKDVAISRISITHTERSSMPAKKITTAT